MPVHYLDGVVTANALAYRKIFDMTQATPNLGEDELPLSQIGPLAIVATTENGYQQARMFAALAEADRPVKFSASSTWRGNGWIRAPTRSTRPELQRTLGNIAHSSLSPGLSPCPSRGGEIWPTRAA